MGILLLLKNINGQTAIALNFKNSNQVIRFWVDLPCPEDFITVYEGERKKSGHRYGLTYSKFDESGKLYTKYIICFSKKESVFLAKKIKEINPNYTTQIEKIY